MPDQHPEPTAERVAHVQRVQRDAADRLLAIPGVLLVALGSKETGGQPTGELAIRVHVTNKRPIDEIPPDERIPAEIDGVPTDVLPGAELRLVAAPPGAVVRSTDTDDRTERPVKGGVRLVPDVTSAKGDTFEGTIGCVLWSTANHDVGFGLTNQHVIDGDRHATVTKGSTEVGQATSTSSSTCCDDIIGVYVAGERTDGSDQAVVRLRSGMKWQAKIVDIGLVSGKRELSAADATARLPVRKRGARTKLTGGTVTDVQGVTSATNNMILIVANDNPNRKPGEPLFFDDEGDSGSVVVDDQNRVCALVFAREKTNAELVHEHQPPNPLPPDGIERPRGVAWSIGDVLARFAAGTPPLALDVATAAADNEVHTVPGAAFVAVPAELAPAVTAEPAAFLGSVAPEGVRAPVGRPWFVADRPPAETLAEIRAALDGSSTGRLLLESWRRNRDEVARLLRTNRRVGVAWHRGGGAAVFQLLLRMSTRPELALPETVHGVPVADCVDGFVAVLTASASPGLADDLRRAGAALPELAGRTLPELLAALADVVPTGVGVGDA